eukprot:tig00020693_g13033.t1
MANGKDCKGAVVERQLVPYFLACNSNVQEINTELKQVPATGQESSPMKATRKPKSAKTPQRKASSKEAQPKNALSSLDGHSSLPPSPTSSVGLPEPTMTRHSCNGAVDLATMLDVHQMKSTVTQGSRSTPSSRHGSPAGASEAARASATQNTPRRPPKNARDSDKTPRPKSSAPPAKPNSGKTSPMRPESPRRPEIARWAGPAFSNSPPPEKLPTPPAHWSVSSGPAQPPVQIPADSPRPFGPSPAAFSATHGGLVAPAPIPAGAQLPMPGHPIPQPIHHLHIGSPFYPPPPAAYVPHHIMAGVGIGPAPDLAAAFTRDLKAALNIFS